MGWRVALVALAGCGRLGFDASGADGSMASIDGRVCVAPVGHDEDADGVDDACDVCPHLAGPQADSDGDGVGDACDPQPAIARQSIAMFDPLISDRGQWLLDNATLDGEGMHLGGSVGYATAQQPLSSTSDTVVIGAEITATSSASYHLNLTGGVDADVYFYCEVYSSSTEHLLQFTYTLGGSSYQHDGMAPYTQPFLGGSGRLAMTIDGNATQCDATWRGTDATVAGTRHAIGVNYVSLAANDCDARISYVLRIASN